MAYLKEKSFRSTSKFNEENPFNFNNDLPNVTILKVEYEVDEIYGFLRPVGTVNPTALFRNYNNECWIIYINGERKLIEFKNGKYAEDDS